MPNPFDPPAPIRQEVGQRLTRGNMSEVEAATTDERNIGGKRVAMPWSTGKPLTSAGMDPATGLPKPPDLIIPVSEGDKLVRELERSVVLDAAAEGVLDIAEAVSAPLLVEEQWFEAEERTAPPTPPWPPEESNK